MIRTCLGALALAAVSLSGVTASSTTAEAMGNGPQVCGPRDTIILRLESRYQERHSAIGMTSGGSLVELFISQEGSWTFVHTNTDEISCLLAAGEDWEYIVPTKLVEDAKPS